MKNRTWFMQKQQNLKHFYTKSLSVFACRGVLTIVLLKVANRSIKFLQYKLYKLFKTSLFVKQWTPLLTCLTTPFSTIDDEAKKFYKRFRSKPNHHPDELIKNSATLTSIPPVIPRDAWRVSGVVISWDKHAI